MKLKIGAFSRITGILTETIRYYEQKGLMEPQRDADNSYRYYDLEDFLDLLRIKQFRSLEIPVSQISENIVDASAAPRQLCDILHKRKEQYEEEIEHLRKKVARISLFEYYLGQKEGQVQPNYVPAVYRLLLSNPAVYNHPHTPEIVRRWITYQPYTHLTLRFSKESLLESNSPYFYPDIGIGLLKRYFDQYGEELTEPIERTSPCDVASLAFTTESIYQIPRKCIEPLLTYARNQGLMIREDVYGLVYYVQGKRNKRQFHVTIHLST